MSSKGQKQPRKTRRQLKEEKWANAQKLINTAKKVENPLSLIDGYQNHILTDESEMKLSCYSIKTLPNKQTKWIFDLMLRNMEEMYKKSSWGWNKEEKEKELGDINALYLIATVGNNNAGFSHFRFDIDDEVDVLYCYELQIEENFRRKGIGRIMMKALEAMTAHLKIQKVVLTVFKHNPSAMSFFTSLGYKPDITNPSESQKMDYTILSKRC